MDSWPLNAMEQLNASSKGLSKMVNCRIKNGTVTCYLLCVSLMEGEERAFVIMVSKSGRRAYFRGRDFRNRPIPIRLCTISHHPQAPADYTPNAVESSPVSNRITLTDIDRRVQTVFYQPYTFNCCI